MFTEFIIYSDLTSIKPKKKSILLLSKFVLLRDECASCDILQWCGVFTVLLKTKI